MKEIIIEQTNIVYNFDKSNPKFSELKDRFPIWVPNSFTDEDIKDQLKILNAIEIYRRKLSFWQYIFYKINY